MKGKDTMDIIKSFLKKKPSTAEQNVIKRDEMIQDLSADDLSQVTGGVMKSGSTSKILGDKKKH